MTSTTIHNASWANHSPAKHGGKNASSVSSQKLLEYWNDFRKWRYKRRQQRIERNALLKLMHATDRELADIGIKRDDVRHAAHLPLEVNAASEIDTLRLKNLAQW